MDDTTFTTDDPGARAHINLLDTHHSTTAIPQPHQPTDTAAMPFLTFSTGPNYYGYEEGVNAANLTSKDIKAANARLPRQQRIKEGLIKATRDDPAYAASKPVAPKEFFDYAKWTKYEMLDAMVARGLATKRTRVKDM